MRGGLLFVLLSWALMGGVAEARPDDFTLRAAHANRAFVEEVCGMAEHTDPTCIGYGWGCEQRGRVVRCSSWLLFGHPPEFRPQDRFRCEFEVRWKIAGDELRRSVKPGTCVPA